MAIIPFPIDLIHGAVNRSFVGYGAKDMRLNVCSRIRREHVNVFVAFWIPYPNDRQCRLAPTTLGSMRTYFAPFAVSKTTGKGRQLRTGFYKNRAGE